MARSTQVSSTTVAQVPLAALIPDPDQPRRDFGKDALKALADNIGERGVQHPILVLKGPKGELVIKDGERRWRAAKLAKLKTVPVLLAGEASDAAETRLDQVAVNTLREGLKPLEIARLLLHLRDDQKLTPNDIAARLAKQGTPMTKQEVETSIALNKLPSWAQAMIDEDTLDPKTAPAILKACDDGEVGKRLPAEFKQALGWRGYVDPRAASQALARAYADAGISLTHTWGDDAKTVHLDYRKVCAKCEHLRRLDGGAVCMSPAGFKEHNQQAKAAGLGPGGERRAKAKAPADTSKLTKRQRDKLEREQADRKARGDATRVENYLDQWLRGRIAIGLTNKPGIAHGLVAWFACGHPDHGLCGNAYVPGGWRFAKEMNGAARKPRLSAWLEGPPNGSDAIAIAIAGLPFLCQPQVRELAKALGVSLERDWTADEDYLRLRTKDQLVAWARSYELAEDEKLVKLKAGELRELLLGNERALKFDAIRDLSQAALLAAYDAPIRDEKAAAEEEADDEWADEPDDADE